MTKSETQPTERIGTPVTNFIYLKPGVLYRLHIHEFDPGERRQTTRPEKFYLTGEKWNLFSPEGLISVEKVDEDENREPSFYKLSDLGMDIERSVDPRKDFDVNLPDMSWANWVEKVPAEDPTPKT